MFGIMNNADRIDKTLVKLVFKVLSTIEGHSLNRKVQFNSRQAPVDGKFAGAAEGNPD
jgi:hypothetical protein